MTPQRINELIQILWNDVDSAEDLQKFIEAYGDELDTDFLVAIGAVVQNANEQGDENMARFFSQIGQAMVPLLMPAGADIKAVSDEEVERSAGLLQKFFEDVKSNDDLARFAAQHLDECDDTFFDALQQLAEGQKAEGNEENARFFEQTGQMLRQIKQQMGADSQAGQASFSGEEARIKAEDDAINELIETDSNAAYPRAAANLERAKQTGNDNLIMYCAFNLARAAQEYRPYPKLNEAVVAYHIAAEKAESANNEQAYGTTQNNLGNAYLNLPTGDRGENLRNAVRCYENALRVRTENDFPQKYATTQNNLGNTYSDLPNARNKSLSCRCGSHTKTCSLR